jgi:hypothetical protein
MLWRSAASPSGSLTLRTTTGDRTERDQLLHRPGGPRVERSRRGREIDGATAPAGAGAAAGMCELLPQARSPARRASGRLGPCVHRSNSQPQGSAQLLPIAACATHRPAGRLLRSQTDSDMRPVTGTARACFRTIWAAPRLRAGRLLCCESGGRGGVCDLGGGEQPTAEASAASTSRSPSARTRNVAVCARRPRDARWSKSD